MLLVSRSFPRTMPPYCHSFYETLKWRHYCKNNIPSQLGGLRASCATLNERQMYFYILAVIVDGWRHRVYD